MKITVVTPSFNQALFIERTIVSVIKQAGVEHEYILIDAQSTDGSQELLRKYADKFDHLIIEPDDGQADAIQKGFAMASGDIFCYLNSDDVLLPGALKYVSDYFEANPGVDAIYSDRIFIDANDKITGFWILPPHSRYLMSRWDFIPQETCFWRRSLMEKSGSIDPSFMFAMDYDLFVRMMKVGRFKHVRRFLGGFRVHPAAKSSNQYETLGRKEIARVQQSQGISRHHHDSILKYLFGGWILGFSWLYKLIKIRHLRRRITF